jgi:hypothetical protein
MININIDGPEKEALRLLCQKNQVKPRELVEYLVNDAFNRTNRAKTKLL